MEFEKIKLALALKELDIVILGNNGSDRYLGYLVHADTSDGHGYRENVLDKDGKKVVRIAGTMDEVADKLYKWVVANVSKK